MSLKPKAVDFNQTWADLRETIVGVITFKNVPRAVWNDRFSDVYSLCVAYPEPLADRLYSVTKTFLKEHVQDMLNNIVRKEPEKLLNNYYESWQVFSEGVKYLNLLFSYLNNQHIKKQKMSDAEVQYGSLVIEPGEQMKEIGELGLDIWKTKMIEPLKDELVRLLLDGIHHDRKVGETGSAGFTTFQSDKVIHGVITSFVAVEEYKKKGNLELYEEIFEKPFLKATGDYYKEEAQKLLQEGNVSHYIQKVIQRIDAENIRSRKFLWGSSCKKVEQECEKQMVEGHIDYLHSESKNMVAQELTSDLSNLYRLLKPVNNALKLLLEEIQTHVKAEGLKATSGLKEETLAFDFVENVLKVYEKYREMIASVFNGDQAFIGSMDKALSAVINFRPPKQAARAPELLAKYCDNLLKKSQKGISEGEINEKLSSSIKVFKYLDDKDVFQKFYARNLGKRLIHQQSHSMDQEEEMINRLKQACGFEFTNKFHRMFTDIKLAEDLNTKFTEFLAQSNTELGVGHFIRVLQVGAWPLSHNALSPLNIPLQLEKTVNMYEAFYAKHFQGRKLTWLHHLSSGDVKVMVTSKTYIINMTTFQMAILLQFEKVDSMTFSELQTATNMSDDQFPRYLQSMLDSKLLLNNKDELNKESVISLNLKYSNKRMKFRIAGTVQRETPQEVEQTHQAVDEDRKMYIQAAIVRIMKSRKLIKHNQLIQEVLSQSESRFAPSIPMIKKCIENLIEKAYIERSAQNQDQYSYMA